MIQSMTAFASRSGAGAGHGWTWEIRGVNGKGLDLRLRLPDGIEGLEPAVRTAATKRLSRGNVTIGLRIVRDDAGQALAIDRAQLDRVLEALATVGARAEAQGLVLAPTRAADILAMRGVVAQAEAEEAPDLLAPLLADLEAALNAFCEMRAQEGQALARHIGARLDEIARLTEEAAAAAEARRDEAREALAAALRRVLDEASEIDEGRIAQELALIAVKSDVAEEIERLGAHVAAARALLADGQPVGRRLDFLAQEFNREANTLCAKAGSVGLTTIGLALKAAIDQMREQVQNVE